MELTIVNNNGKLLVDSRQVAEMVGKNHADLLRSIKGFVGILTESNFALSDFFIEDTYQDSTGRSLPCYSITKKGCDMIGNKLTGEKGVLFTATYVTEFENMQRQLQFTLPTSFAEALRQLASTVEVNEQLAKENALMLPKAEFFDAVADSKDAVEMNAVAKVLAFPKMGRNNLFEFLRNQKILMNNNQPMQRFIDNGYFRVIEQKYMKKGEQCITFKTLVYQKGLEHIRKMLNKEFAGV